MLNRIQTREILAWLTLAIAFILLGATIALGQTKTINVENDNGKVHLKISKTENGKTVKIDTTFEITDDADLDKIIQELSGNDDDHFSISSQSKSKNSSSKSKGSLKKKKHVVVDLNLSDASKEDMEDLHYNIEKSMKDLKNGLRDMSSSLSP